MRGDSGSSSPQRVAAAAFTLVACGGSGGDSGGGARKAAADAGKLSDKPMTLTFLWFEWPPAHGARGARQGVHEDAPERDRQGQHRAERAVARRDLHAVRRAQDELRHADPRLAEHRRGGDQRVDPRHHGLREEEHRHVAVRPVLPRGVRPVPAGADGRGQPGRQDLRAAAARRHVVDDLAQGPDGRQASRDVGGHDRRGQEVPGGEPGHERPRVPSGRHRRRRRRHLQRHERALRRRAVERRSDRKIEGVINDAAGKKAMDVLVNEMVPLTPKGSSNWFIDEVNAAISQGKVCVGFQWIAAMGGLLDPKSSKLGKTKEEILKKLAFAPLPKQDTDKVPLGGMGLHVSQVHPGGEAGRGAELHQVVPDARGPEEVGAARRRPGAQRRPQLARVPRGAAVQQGVHGVRAASEGLLEPARVREAPQRPLDAGQRGDLRHASSPTRRSTSWRPRSRQILDESSSK